MNVADKDALIARLQPLLARIAALAPAERVDAAAVRELEATLDAEWSPEGAEVRALGEAIAEGVAAGWLCDRGEPDARFSRVAKAGPQTHGLSIDVVRLRGAALQHTHPKGEVTLGFAVEGEPTFEDRAPGWVFLPPGSTHVPQTRGGVMDLIYFLPDGAVVWGG